MWKRRREFGFSVPVSCVSVSSPLLIPQLISLSLLYFLLSVFPHMWMKCSYCSEARLDATSLLSGHLLIDVLISAAHTRRNSLLASESRAAVAPTSCWQESGGSDREADKQRGDVRTHWEARQEEQETRQDAYCNRIASNILSLLPNFRTANKFQFTEEDSPQPALRRVGPTSVEVGVRFLVSIETVWTSSVSLLWIQLLWDLGSKVRFHLALRCWSIAPMLLKPYHVAMVTQSK